MLESRGRNWVDRVDRAHIPVCPDRAWVHKVRMDRVWGHKVHMNRVSLGGHMENMGEQQPSRPPLPILSLER
jgi:hypothetical protein